MKSNSEVQIDRHLNSDDLIVIAGAGGSLPGLWPAIFTTWASRASGP